METRCLNCDRLYAGAFCPDCGQPAATGRLVTSELAREAVSHFLSLDSQALRTVVGLFRAPGRVAREYVAGRRIRYVPPLRYCLTILAVVVLVNVFSGLDPAKLNVGVDLTPQQQAVQRAVGGFVLQHLDLVLIAVLPVFVLVVKILFRGSRFNYAEVSVFVLYTIGQLFLIGLLLTPLKTSAPALAALSKVFLQIVLLSWAAVDFFEVPPWIAFLKCAIATAIYFVLVGLTVLLLTLPTVVAIVRSGGAASAG